MTQTADTPKYLVEFPDFGPLDVAIPEGFVDSSWHNDACPCWINETLHLRLMIDYADVEKRETGNETDLRFLVDRLTHDNMVDPDGSTEAFATYDEALAVIICEQFVTDLKDDLSVAEWEAMRRKNSRYPHEACASQDFCDANQTMFQAMRTLEILSAETARDDWANEETLESKRLVGLWNSAWKIAKARHLTAPK